MFPETTSLGQSNYTGPSFQINDRTVIKIIKKSIFWAQNVLFKVQNRPIIEDEEVSGQLTTKFSEIPNPGITAGARTFFSWPKT